MTSLRALLLDCGTALRRADPAFESSPLRARIEDAILALARANGDSPDEHLAVRRELDALRQSLADAIPGVDDRIPAAEAARLRMRMLIDAGARLRAVPTPPQVVAEPADVQPSRAVLQDVAAGSRALTREEREWCLTEAMVLSGFRQTPVQLIENGEPALAKMILAGSPLD